MSLLVNIDVPDLEVAVRFYTQAFGLRVTRRFGAGGAELSGWAAPVYLLVKAPGSVGAGSEARRYERHWTPVHLDVVVEDIDAALARALEAGAVLERPVSTDVWGRLAVLADPFGHGLCLVQFLNRGYDEVSERVGGCC
ncbi:VOC family protein [Zavarzinia sp. CC-PAN008]|uniref:VOC family protein n=1 Tax=Zavarzinia sp. CC-PAN008 TaxID=3243332 RepID=UPI003F748E94